MQASPRQLKVHNRLLCHSDEETTIARFRQYLANIQRTQGKVNHQVCWYLHGRLQHAPPCL